MEEVITIENMKGIRCFAALAVIFAPMMLPFVAPVQAAEVVPFMTVSAGGTAFVLGAGMVTVTNKYSTSGPRLVHEATSGTLEMVRKLIAAEKQKKPVIAMFGATEGWDAYRGLRDYEGKAFPGLRSICYNQDMALYLVVTAKSGIKSYADLKGKRVAIGGPGSTIATTALVIMQQYGITKKDFSPFYYNFREMIDGVADGSLDGGFIGGAYPVAGVTEISTTHDVRIVPVDENVLDKIVKERPGYIKTVIKAKWYRGTDQDTPVLGWTSGVHTHSATPDPIVYNFLKTLFGHLPDFYEIHMSAKNLSKETATRGMHVPFHPAAEKYLKEIGAMK